MYIPFIQGDLFPTVYIIVTVIKRENIRSIQKMTPPSSDHYWGLISFIKNYFYKYITFFHHQS